MLWNNDIKTKIKNALKGLVKKKNVLIVKRGNAAIKEVISLAKEIGREKILIQDQGGWITYKQFANKEGLMCIELKTDYGLTDLDDLEKKADGKSVFIINSLSGYHAEEDMHKIKDICNKKRCLLVNDVSGSIGLSIATKGDIILGSFNRWKPINMCSGGFIAFDNQIPSRYELVQEKNKFVQKYFDMIGYFHDFEEFVMKDTEFEKLYKKIKDAKSRHKFFSKTHWKAKKDLKNLDIIHPKSYGINVIIKYNGDDEKNKIIKYCEDNKLEYTECPRYIRVNENAISIEIKRL